ncbi:hypothetical protein C9374_013562 [Naegleria lovaniensis]|uniref:ATP-dependent RNA helicase n=1 Tax=Naegleria lovaniensis TaxID=51637 RepID=A0AA88KQ94_NAELO|nr:uncharacterized protein C9374_013562 [Naegleria lovaniensis]KAG2392077.1 hypothetical protein C9374_013562 [Naegleria lovaniensis]
MNVRVLLCDLLIGTHLSKTEYSEEETMSFQDDSYLHLLFSKLCCKMRRKFIQYLPLTSFELIPNVSRELLQGIYSTLKTEKPSFVQSHLLGVLFANEKIKCQNDIISATTIALTPRILPLCTNHVIVNATPNSGKTTAWIIYLLQQLSIWVNNENPTPESSILKHPHAIILCRRNETVYREASKLQRLGEFMNFVIFRSYNASIDEYMDVVLKNRPIIIVGTPSNVLHLMKRRVFHLRFVKYLILEELEDVMEHVHVSRQLFEIISLVERSSCRIIGETHSMKRHEVRQSPIISMIANQLKPTLVLNICKQTQKCLGIVSPSLLENKVTLELLESEHATMNSNK